MSSAHSSPRHKHSTTAHDPDTADELQLDNDDDDHDHLHHTALDDTDPPLDLEADDDAYSPHHPPPTDPHDLPPPPPPQPAPPPPQPAPLIPIAAPVAAPVAVAVTVASSSSKRSSPSPRGSQSSRSAAKEREQRVILPITAAPITRQNQDDTVVGIQPHHVDFDDDSSGSGEEEEEEAGMAEAITGSDGMWYEEELLVEDTAAVEAEEAEAEEEEEEGEVWKAPTVDTTTHDREVSDIMSRTPSYSQQRAKELAIVAAIKAEKERYPGQIITSPPSIPPSSTSSPSTNAATTAITAIKPIKTTTAAVSPAFSYPGTTTHAPYIDPADEQAKGRTSASASVSPAPSPSAAGGSMGGLVLGRWWLLCYGVALFSSVMFEFAAIVLLMHLFRDTLLPASLFGLLESITHALSPLLIRWVMASPGAPTAQPGRWLLGVSVLSLHVAIIACALVFHYSLTATILQTTHAHYTLLIAILLLGMAAKLALDLTKSAVHSLSAASHASQAAAVQRIEVCCALLAPLVFGAVSTYNEPDVAVLVCVGWSAVGGGLTLAVGCCCGSGGGGGGGGGGGVRRKRVSEGGGDGVGIGGSSEVSEVSFGSKKKHNKPTVKIVVHTSHTPDDHHIASPTATSLPTTTSTPPSHGGAGGWLGSTLSSLFYHPHFLPALSYAFLSLSILSFSVDMIAFLSTAAVSDFALGAGRSVQALLALVPPLFIDRLTRRLSLPVTGVLVVWLQCVLLSPIVVIFVLTDRHSVQSFVLPLYLCLCCGSLSQSAFTAIESPLVLRNSAPSHSHSSLALRILIHLAIFFSYLLTIVCFNPEWFIVPVAISFGCVVCAAVVYSVHAWRGGSRGREYSAVGGGGGGMELVGGGGRGRGGKGGMGGGVVSDEVEEEGEVGVEEVEEVGLEGDGFGEGEGGDEYEVRMEGEEDGHVGHAHSPEL